MQAASPLHVTERASVDFAFVGHTASPTPNNRPDRAPVNSTALKFSIQNRKVIPIALPCNSGVRMPHDSNEQSTGSAVQSDFDCISTPEATKHTR